MIVPASLGDASTCPLIKESRARPSECVLPCGADEVRRQLQGVRRKCDDEDEALSAAAAHGHTNIVSMLLDHGADIHAQADEALQAASRNGQSDTVALLLARGSDASALNGYALSLAQRYGHDAVASLLANAQEQARTGKAQARAPACCVLQ